MIKKFQILRQHVCSFLREPQKAKRFYVTYPKRFYKHTYVLHNDGSYEVTLDNRKLKTPIGTVFTVKSQPLAVAVATEFDHQKENIQTNRMHISALCFTAIDNPNKHTKEEMVNYLVNFLPTDTVLFQNDNEKDLYEVQCKEWDPIIEWFNKRYETNIEKTMSITPPRISDEDKNKISNYLLSNPDKDLFGFVYAVDTLKSIILAFATIDQQITIEKAVSLARLEEEFQLKFWGRVEWAHDINKEELQARLAASVLYVHFNRTDNVTKEKRLSE